jgi:hypothetical protein
MEILLASLLMLISSPVHVTMAANSFNVYTSHWAVEIGRGMPEKNDSQCAEEANFLASKHGFTNMGQVLLLI